jgi:probable phosphoglycerate mutase
LTLSPRDVERPRIGETRPSGAVPLIPDGLDAFVVLLRHGETQAIVENRFQGQMETPLTPTGERQAQLAGVRLARPKADPPLPIPGGPPLAIVHSPLSRAARSAEIVADAMREAGMTPPQLRPDPGLSELAQGVWEGLTHNEITARYGEVLAAWRRWPTRVHAPGGESLDQVRDRVEIALETLLAELAAGAPTGTLDRHQVLGYAGHAGATDRWALLVAHSGVLKVVVCTMLGLPLEHFWNFDFGLASISVIEIRAGRAVLRALNLDSHLGREAEPINAEGAERDATGAL